MKTPLQLREQLVLENRAIQKLQFEKANALADFDARITNHEERRRSLEYQLIELKHEPTHAKGEK